MASAIDMVLVTRRDCGLCEEMEATVEEFVESGDVSCRRLDVDSAPDLAARYGDEVPVLLVNGRKAFKYRVGAAQLRARIRSEKRRALAKRLRGFLSGANT